MSILYVCLTTKLSSFFKTGMIHETLCFFCGCLAQDSCWIEAGEVSQLCRSNDKGNRMFNKTQKVLGLKKYKSEKKGALQVPWHVIRVT